jgi:hypothetical protein
MSISKRPAHLNLSITTNPNIITTHIIEEETEQTRINAIDNAVMLKMFDYERACKIAASPMVRNIWNQEYIDLSNDVDCVRRPRFLEYNYDMTLFAATYIFFYKYALLEESASIFHRKWLSMYICEWEGPLDMDYDLLPENEKQKFRDIYNTMLEAVKMH